MAPVEPLVPVLLDVPVVEPLVDGEVVVELPLAPMPELVPELDDGIDEEELDDGERVVELPVEPIPDVDPEVDAPVEPMVDEPLLVPEVDGLDCVAVDEDEGLVEPLADPPAAPMPEAEPLAVPEADGPELQAARAAEQAMARINLFIRISLSNPARRVPRRGVPRLPCQRSGTKFHGARLRVRHRRGGLSDEGLQAQRSAFLDAQLPHDAIGPEQQHQFGLSLADRVGAVHPHLVAVVERHAIGLAQARSDLGARASARGDGIGRSLRCKARVAEHGTVGAGQRRKAGAAGQEHGHAKRGEVSAAHRRRP